MCLVRTVCSTTSQVLGKPGGFLLPLEDSMDAHPSRTAWPQHAAIQHTPASKGPPPKDIVMPRANRNERTRHGSSPP